MEMAQIRFVLKAGNQSNGNTQMTVEQYPIYCLYRDQESRGKLRMPPPCL